MNQKSNLAIAAAAMFLASATTYGSDGEGKKALKSTGKKAKTICVGGNSCKEQGACHTAHNDCKGQNSCKGKSWVYVKDQATCKRMGGKFRLKKDYYKDLEKLKAKKS